MALDIEKVDVVEILVSCGSIKHNLEIYLKSLAERNDMEGSSFYQNIVAAAIGDVEKIEAEIKKGI